MIVSNVKNKFYGNSAFEPTGPLLLKRQFNEDELTNMPFSIGEHECPTQTCLYYENKPILAMYAEYRDEQVTISDKPNYHELWKTKNIYT